MSEHNCPHSCVDCGTFSCGRGGFAGTKEDSPFPPFCLTTNAEEELMKEVMELYQEEENKTAMIAAAEVEHEFYCQLTRLQETKEFAKKIGAKRIGIAFCGGVKEEAKIVSKYFRHHGFEVYGACCKVGSVPKTEMGIPAVCSETTGKIACNPIMQAKILNKAGTDLNVLMGLCVGHDSLYYKYCDGLCTTLFTKDRVLGHNAASVIYQANGYYKKKLFD